MEKEKESFLILLIENNSDISERIKEILIKLKGFDFNLNCTDNMPAGLSLIHTGEVDLVILDLHLSKNRGIGLIKDIFEFNPTLPVIVLIDPDKEKMGIMSLQEGAQDYFIKDNINEDIFLKTLRCSIERQKLLKSLYEQIADHKRLEYKLRQNGKKYCSVFENIQDIYYEVSFDGEILVLSPSVEQVSGYKREDLIGKKMKEIYVYPKERKKLQDIIRKEGKVTDYEIQMKDKDGALIPCSITSKVEFDENGNPLKIIGTMRNISRRKKLEEEKLKSKQEEKQLVLDSVPAMIFSVDKEGRFIEVNKAFANAFNDITENIKGKSMFELLPKEPAIKHYNENIEIIKTGIPRLKRIEPMYTPGGVIWVSIDKTPYLDKKGNVIGIIGIATDITEHKKVEDNLKIYKYMVESANDAIFFKDLESRYIVVNEKTLEVFGLSREEVIGKNDYQLMPDEKEARKNVEDDQFVCKTGKLKEVVKHMSSADGREYWFQAVKVPQYDEGGNIVGLVGVARDITEHKKAEIRLHLLGSAVEQADEAIIITDLDGKIQYVNSAFERITGYSREEALHKNSNILKSGKHNAGFYKNLWDTIINRKVWRGQFINKTKEKVLYHEEATIFPVLDSNGKIVNYVKIASDISEKIKLENQLRQSQKMEAIGRLAGGIAHDFNNILMGIQGNVELAGMSLSEEDPISEYLEDTGEAVKKAKELVNHLLAFSRKQIVKARAINLNEIIRNMEKMIRRIISEDIIFLLDLAPAIPAIKADPNQIEQVVMNLVINARDSMPKGGLLTVKTEVLTIDKSSRIKHPFARSGKYVVIGVSDTGIGMDEKTLSQIFDPFFTTKGKEKGSGLGLSVVFGIVKQFGGCILVDSKVDDGSTFRVCFPRTEQKINVANKKTNFRETIHPGSGTILVVEDEGSIRRVIKKILNKAGYKAIIASNGDEALSICENLTEAPDLLLTDLVMPGMSGYELATRISDLFPDTRILFMSGYSDDILDKHSISINSTNFIRKPFSLIDLQKLIREILNK